MGFHMPKIQQILKRFTRAFHQARINLLFLKSASRTIQKYRTPNPRTGFDLTLIQTHAKKIRSVDLKYQQYWNNSICIAKQYYFYLSTTFQDCANKNAIPSPDTDLITKSLSSPRSPRRSISGYSNSTNNNLQKEVVLLY